MRLRGIALGAVALVAGGFVASACSGGDSSANEADSATADLIVPTGASDDESIDDATPLIAVSGEGTVEGEPDVMTIGLGVETTAETATEALQDNNRRANDVLVVLAENGVEEADVQTAGLSVVPNFDDDRNVTGYRVNNTISATIRDLDDAGAIIDAVAFVTGDAIRLRGLSFSIDDPTALLAEARTQAVEQAMTQADQLTSAAGVALGEVRSIDETNRLLPRPFEDVDADALRGAADSGFESTPIRAGSQEISVVVTMVYEIDQ